MSLDRGGSKEKARLGLLFALGCRQHLRLHTLKDMTDMQDQAKPIGTTASSLDNSGIPPLCTQDQQDHQLQAMTFAFAMLAKALHAEGVLDLSALPRELDHAKWLFQGRPGVQRVVAELAADLRDMRAKVGEPGSRRATGAAAARPPRHGGRRWHH